MNASDVKEFLSDRDIFGLLEDLGAEPYEQGNNIFCKTICHGGSKHKLIYFKDSKSFNCFTDSCGRMDIFKVVGSVLHMNFADSFRYVCSKFGIKRTGNFSSDKIDVSFFRKFKREKPNLELDCLNENVLNTYYDYCHKSWIDDGISIRSMKKYGVLFSIQNNQIIIPHRDFEGKLVGVRVRNLNKDLVDDGKKYMPAYWKGKLLNHPTGAVLYGLDKNREMIEKYRTVILFESEKAVMQLDTMMPDMSIGLCLSGSSLTQVQLEILKMLDIEEVIIALDKEFEEIGDDDEKFYAEKIKSVFLDKLSPYFKTSVIWDMKKRLDLKDSPTDKGYEPFKALLQERLFV